MDKEFLLKAKSDIEKEISDAEKLIAIKSRMLEEVDSHLKKQMIMNSQKKGN